MRETGLLVVVLMTLGLGSRAVAQESAPDESAPDESAPDEPAPDASSPSSPSETPAPQQAAPPPQTPKDPPPPTPIPAAPAAPVSADAACFPDCRAGFLCHRGTCISACNPPCPDGQSCTPQRTCEPNAVPQSAPRPPTRVLQAPAPVPPPSPAPAPQPLEARPEPEQSPEPSRHDRLRQWRLDHLEDPHLTLDLFARTHGVNNRDTDPLAAAASVALGYARNTSRRFGFMLRGVASLGAVAMLPGEEFDYEGAKPTAAYYALEAELIPYLGPLGIFYIGPILSAGYHGYSKDKLVAAGRGEQAKLRDGKLFGLGLAMGFFAGETRRVHVGGFAKTTFTNWMPYQLGASIGYRFGPEGSEFR